MPNTSERAYGLTTLCPIKENTTEGQCAIFYTRDLLQNLSSGDEEDPRQKKVSPLAAVPNTYMARFLILDEALFQGHPYKEDQLQSCYLVFTSNFHGELDPYLRGMYRSMKASVFAIWKHCYGFEIVEQSEANGRGEDAFVDFIKKCQVKTTFFFKGSNDDSLVDQLKALYLKQELSKFVYSHQGADADKLLNDFKAFMKTTRPGNPASPTWKAGLSQQD